MRTDPKPARPAAAIGLVAALFAAFGVMAFGTTYLLWPAAGSVSVNSLGNDTYANITALGLEPPRDLNAILQDAPVGQAAVGERLEVRLNGPLGRPIPVDGGRLLLIPTPAKNEVAVFDVAAKKVVAKIDVTERDAMLAGAKDVFLIYEPEAGRLRRFSARTLRLEKSMDRPFPSRPIALAAGHSSTRPFVAVLEQDQGAVVKYFSLQSLTEEVPDWVDGEERLPAAEAVGLRVSGDGSTVTVFAPAPRGFVEVQRRSGKEVSRLFRNGGPTPALPSADGQRIFGRTQIYGRSLQPLGQSKAGHVELVPSLTEDYYALLRRDLASDGHTLEVYQSSQNLPIGPAVEVPELRVTARDPRAVAPLDRAVFLLPGRRLVVVVIEGGELVLIYPLGGR